MSSTYKKDLLKWLESQFYWPLMNPAVSSWYSSTSQSSLMRQGRTWKIKTKVVFIAEKFMPKNDSPKIFFWLLTTSQLYSHYLVSRGSTMHDTGTWNWYQLKGARFFYLALTAGKLIECGKIPTWLKRDVFSINKLFYFTLRYANDWSDMSLTLTDR